MSRNAFERMALKGLAAFGSLLVFATVTTLGLAVIDLIRGSYDTDFLIDTFLYLAFSVLSLWVLFTIIVSIIADGIVAFILKKGRINEDLSFRVSLFLHYGLLLVGFIYLFLNEWGVSQLVTFAAFTVAVIVYCYWSPTIFYQRRQQKNSDQ